MRCRIRVYALVGIEDPPYGGARFLYPVRSRHELNPCLAL